MLEFYLPYLIAIVLGIAPPSDAAAPAAPDVAAAPGKPAPAPPETAPPETAAPETAAPETAAAEDATPARTPEPQVNTGRFLTALEVRPILTATRPQWIAVREFDGQDLLYFTQLLSWRCGLWEIRYGLNGAPATTSLPLEPCHEDTASPGALTDSTGAYPIYITAPLGSITQIDVEIVYDDGTTDANVYQRAWVLMP